jgi:hypothetical protein
MGDGVDIYRAHSQEEDLPIAATWRRESRVKQLDSFR